MPLFLDLHKAGDYEAKPTAEEIKKNHIADLSVQEKYGVRFIQYWINEDQGMVFCLMEGPDKESCAAVHREAHGNMPCNVIELKGGDYKTYLGEEGKANQFDIVENPDGTFDSGTRIFISIDLLPLENPSASYNIIRDAFTTFYGREISHPGDRLLAVFNSAHQATGCAATILKRLKEIKKTDVQIGIGAGYPLTDKDNFFEAGVNLAHRHCDVAIDGHVFVAANVKGLSGTSFESHKSDAFKIITVEEEKFINRLLDIIQPSLDQPDLNVDGICKQIGISRAQLYRKLVSITGMAPNNFIKELRLKKAVRLIKRNKGNIAQVAYECGFNNPSYFSTIFQRRFGILPSELS
jgi:AraC-like DNA-binding protein